MNSLDLILLIFCLLVLYYLRNGAIFVPTHPKTIQDMLASVEIQPGMKLVDLGSGDGRILLAFADRGVVTIGYEVNPIVAIWSWIKIARAKISPRPQVIMKSFWSADLSGFDVVVVFGMNHIMDRLEGKLKQELRPGTIILSNIFKFKNLHLIKTSGSVLVYQI